MKIECMGCRGEAVWLVSGRDYNPNGLGPDFVDEPACDGCTEYLEESAAELGLPFNKRRIEE